MDLLALWKHIWHIGAKNSGQSYHNPTHFRHMNGGQILECMEKIVALLSIVVEVTVKKGLDKGELLEIWRKL